MSVEELIDSHSLSNAARFNRIVQHYISHKSTKMWRANAEPLIEALLPADFNIQGLFNGNELHLLELAALLQDSACFCRLYLKREITHYIDECSKGPDYDERNLDYALLVLKVLAKPGNGERYVGRSSLFPVLSYCFSHSFALRANAVKAWNNSLSGLSSKEMYERFLFSKSMLEDEDALDFVVQSNPECVDYSDMQLSRGLVCAAYRQKKDEFLALLLEEMPTLPEPWLSSDNSLEGFWLRLLHLAYYPIPAECSIHLHLVCHYLGLENSLPARYECVKDVLKGKVLERFVIITCRALECDVNFKQKDFPAFSQALLNSHKWIWALQMPEAGRSILSVIHEKTMKQLLENESSFLLKEPFFWARMTELVISRIKYPCLDAALDFVKKRKINLKEIMQFHWAFIRFKSRRAEAKELEHLDFNILAQHMEVSWPRIDQAVPYFTKHSDYFETCQPVNLRMAAVYSRYGINMSVYSMTRIISFLCEYPDNPDVADYSREMKMKSPNISVECSKQSVDSHIDELYEALIEPLEHDHDHVVGYSSCCAECYCD